MPYYNIPFQLCIEAICGMMETSQQWSPTRLRLLSQSLLLIAHKLLSDFCNQIQSYIEFWTILLKLSWMIVTRVTWSLKPMKILQFNSDWKSTPTKPNPNQDGFKELYNKVWLAIVSVHSFYVVILCAGTRKLSMYKLSCV